MSRTATIRRLGQRLRELLLAWADFAQTLQSQTAVKTRDEVARMVMLDMLGGLHGTPVIPAPFRLRLLPYFVPKIYQWRRKRAESADFSAEIKGGC